jgi:uncharacterized membrane protein YhaH (DUF805 family)
MNWYLAVLKNYVGFSGRARRTEFWVFVLVNAVVQAVLSIVGNAMDNNVLLSIYSLLVLLPTIAVWVRRLHDTGRSGFWLFIGLIPIVGFIVLLVFALIPGAQGPNQYGPDPKQAVSFA